MKSVPFIIGKKLDLHILNEELHLEKCVEWLNKKSVTMWLLTSFPVNFADEKEWFNKKTTNPKTDIVLAMVLKDGTYIGNVGIHRLDWISGTAEMGIFIGEEKYWGNGYATEAESLIGKYAFEDLGLRKITARIYADNIASLKAAKKNGAVEEGILRQHIWRNGKYNDLIVFAIFRDDQSKN